MIKKNMCLSLFLVFIFGCSLFQPPCQVLKINTREPGVVVIVNGEAYQTPNMVMVKRNKDVSIYCNKEGYHPYTKTIGHHFNLTGVLDFAGTFVLVFPVFGLFSKGIWSLNATEVDISLLPVNYNESGDGQ